MVALPETSAERWRLGYTPAILPGADGRLPAVTRGKNAVVRRTRLMTGLIRVRRNMKIYLGCEKPMSPILSRLFAVVASNRVASNRAALIGPNTPPHRLQRPFRGSTPTAALRHATFIPNKTRLPLGNGELWLRTGDEKRNRVHGNADPVERSPARGRGRDFSMTTAAI